jgi:hypothetical protein
MTSPLSRGGGDLAELGVAEFLERLWGPEPPGLIELWTLAGRKSHYLRSPLGAGVVAAPGRPDVYTGVALAFKALGAGRRARAIQRIALAGLWLDLDVCGGPDGKTGAAPSKDAAAELAGAIVEPTLVVDSGYGVHAWYLFEEPWRFENRDEQHGGALAAAQWYALHRARANARGWTIDHTHDLARLLRIPGTVNAKDPEHPRPVRLLHDSGTRYPRELLLEHAAAAGDVLSAATARGGPVSFVLHSNAQLEEAVLDALEANAPEFHDTLTHRRAGTEGWSMSEWDLSIATQAAAAGWTDQRIADLLVWHRRSHDPEDTKAGRADYLRRTIAVARSHARREQAADTLRELAGRRAA